MQKQTVGDYAYELTSTSQDGFGPDPQWIAEQRATGTICEHCLGLLPGQLKHISEVRILNEPEPKTHIGTLGQIADVKVFSQKLVELIGLYRLQAFGHTVPILHASGKVYSTFTALLIDEMRSPGTARGSTPSPSSVCRDCGRLRYWPGPSPTKWQVLRNDWPQNEDLAFVGYLFCSARLWEDRIRPAKLKQLKGFKVPFVDEPPDGLPANYDELKQELKRRGKIH